MSSLPILFLIVVMGGAIAFFADRLGRKLGKKRLSLFKMRPRHTAEVLTVGAGMVIPILTILILYTVSADIRQWIKEGPSIVGVRDKLQLQTVALQRDVKTANAELLGLQAKTKELFDKFGKIKADLANRTQERDKVGAEAQRLKGQIAGFRTELTSLRAQLASGKREILVVRNDLKAKQQALNLAIAAKAQVDASFRRQQDEIKQSQIYYRELDRNNQQLEKDIEARKAEITKLEADKAKLESDKKELDKQLEQAQAAVNKLQDDLGIAAHEVELKQQDLERLTVALEGNVAITRTKPMVYQVGTELARITLGPRQSQADARAAIQALVSQSRDAAEKNGVKPSTNGEATALLRDLPDGKGNRLTVEQQKEMLVKAVSNLPEESVLVAYSLWNVFEGESVPLQILPFRNPLVYKAGDLIAEGRIDGRLSEDEILHQVNAFLQTSVRARAQRDHMIPVGVEGSYGTVTSEQMLDIVRQLKERNLRVRLQAVATNDTRAADPLLLYFKIKY